MGMEGLWGPIKFTKKGITVYRMFIDGEWVESSKRKTFDVLNPATNEIVGKVQRATKEDVERAIQAANKAKKELERMKVIERIELLKSIGNLILEHQEDFIDILIREAGKPYSQAKGEVIASAERMRLVDEEVKVLRGEYIQGDLVSGVENRFAIVIKKPIGVVATISPFNYPLFATVSKITPAILAGNTVVVKPASDDPICVLMLARLVELVGLKKGILNVITGTGSDIGDFLVKHPLVGMISFTGSSSVGKHIASIAGMKKLQLELGGKCPAIVLDDLKGSDLDLAVKECVKGALKLSGQRCDAVSRILVLERIADEFVEKVLEEVKNWKVGDPRNPETNLGPLINEKAVKKVDSLVKDAIKKGARLLFGGKRDGLFYYPTVLDRVTTDMKIAWEETFGPVITIIRVKDIDEAMSIANESEYALDACVFTQDIDKALEIAKELEAGSVTINGAPSHGVGIFPFGGDKSSGMGREGINYSMEEMTKYHTIVFGLTEGEW
jgi:acyl-CoA reductase-like NAD-dependent aldehyde dehydrogenase